MATIQVELPLSTLRALQRAAERRSSTADVVAGQLITSRLEPTVASKRRQARRAVVARWMDLNYSAGEIAARIGCDEKTARADMRMIRAARIRDAA
jgi:hypothetical protein